MAATTRWLLVAQLFLAAGCATGLRPMPASPLAHKMVEEAGRDAPLEVAPGSPLAALERRHVLFVGGFLSEVIPGYFVDNAEVAHELGAQTSVVFPSSAAGLEEDAAFLREEALSRFNESGRPVVLVGHSKGGAAALLTALRYPELVLTGVVDRVVVVQGAVGGSPLAETFARSSALRTWRGLNSLTTHEARRLFDDELANVRTKVTPDGLERLFARVFYVRSWEARGHTSFELALTHGYLQGFGSGQNDGLLLQEDMKLDHAGVDLGVVASDHASLTVSGLLSKSTAADRKAFTRALFREIYGSDAGQRTQALASAPQITAGGTRRP